MAIARRLTLFLYAIISPLHLSMGAAQNTTNAATGQDDPPITPDDVPHGIKVIPYRSSGGVFFQHRGKMVSDLTYGHLIFDLDIDAIVMGYVRTCWGFPRVAKQRFAEDPRVEYKYKRTLLQLGDRCGHLLDHTFGHLEAYLQIPVAEYDMYRLNDLARNKSIQAYLNATRETARLTPFAKYTSRRVATLRSPNDVPCYVFPFPPNSSSLSPNQTQYLQDINEARIALTMQEKAAERALMLEREIRANHELGHEVPRKSSRLSLLKRLARHTLQRQKRQFVAGAIVGGLIVHSLSSLFSTGSLFGLSTQAQTSPLTIETLQDHETRLAQSERSIHVLNQTMTELLLAAQVFSDELKFLEFATQADLALSSAERHIQAFNQGLRALHRNELPPTLIPHRTLQLGQSRLTHRVTEAGLQLLAKDTTDIYTFPTSFLFFVNGTLRVFVHLPLYRRDSLLELYQMVPVPIGLENEKVLVPTPGFDFLAVTHDRFAFRELKRSEINQCRIAHDVYYCPDQNYLKRERKTSCLFSLYQADINLARELCTFGIRAKQDFLTQLSATKFLLFTASPQQLTINCPSGHHQEQGLPSGEVEILLLPGCKASSQSYTFSGATVLKIEPLRVKFAKLNISLLLPDHLRTVPFARLQSSLGQIGTSEGLTIKDISSKLWAESSQTTTTYTIVISLTLIGSCVGGLIIWKCYDRCTRRREKYLRTYADKMHYSSCPNLPSQPTEHVPYFVTSPPAPPNHVQVSPQHASTGKWQPEGPCPLPASAPAEFEMSDLSSIHSPGASLPSRQSTGGSSILRSTVAAAEAQARASRLLHEGFGQTK